VLVLGVGEETDWMAKLVFDRRKMHGVGVVVMGAVKEDIICC
jgi:pyruvate/2-oxoglutarate dehydrogenase complex dihydrolipoamide dehydrogenase (E3) component